MRRALATTFRRGSIERRILESYRLSLFLIESAMIESLFNSRYRELLDASKDSSTPSGNLPITPEAALKYSNRSQVTAYSGHA